MNNYRGLEGIDLQGLRPEVHGLEAETKTDARHCTKHDTIKNKTNHIIKNNSLCNLKELILFSKVIKFN